MKKKHVCLDTSKNIVPHVYCTVCVNTIYIMYEFV